MQTVPDRVVESSGRETSRGGEVKDKKINAKNLSRKFKDAIQELEQYGKVMKCLQIHDIALFFENENFWHDTDSPFLYWSYMEERMYVIMECTYGGLKKYSFITASNPNEAIEKYRLGEQ